MYNFLKSHLYYDEVTGNIYYKDQEEPISKTNSNGYIEFSLYGIRLTGHQVAMCFIKREWSLMVVDHKNTDRADNRRDNLREASRGLNSANKLNPNKSGERNIRFLEDRNPSTKRYMLSIYKDGKYHHRKAYHTMEEAIKARKECEVTLYGEELI